jgi:hypothetical protein
MALLGDLAVGLGRDERLVGSEGLEPPTSCL